MREWVGEDWLAANTDLRLISVRSKVEGKAEGAASFKDLETELRRVEVTVQFESLYRRRFRVTSKTAGYIEGIEGVLRQSEPTWLERMLGLT